MPDPAGPRTVTPIGLPDGERRASSNERMMSTMVSSCRPPTWKGSAVPHTSSGVSAQLRRIDSSA